MRDKRKTLALGGLVAMAAMAVAAATWARQETEAGGEPAAAVGKVPEGWEVVDGTPGALGFAKKARDPATGITFILVEPGKFQMGSPQGEEGEVGGEFFADDRPQHEVEITKPFYLGETEVTVGQWREFAQKTKYRTEAEETGEGGYTVNATGGVELHKEAVWSRPLPLHEFDLDDLHPVTQVSWNDAQAFCEQYGCRLPSEAEWEYACRAGTSTAYWWGDAESDGKGKGNFGDQAAKRKFSGWTAFSFDDGHAFTAPVGTDAPNPWGFRDMLGNVCEWCADLYDNRYYGRSPKVDPVNAGGAGGGARSFRGGSWFYSPRFCRSASRGGGFLDSRYSSRGFRVARTPCGEVGKVPEGWEVVDGTPGAQGFAKKARDPATGTTFILVEPGTFQMGSPEAGESPQHEVVITKPFYLGETEVTVGQWGEFAWKTGYRTEAEETGEGGYTTDATGGLELHKEAVWSKPIPLHEYEWNDLHPVTQVSWNDAEAFCEEYGCRLPSEAEWEYACRAGTSTAYWWGDEMSGGKGNFADQRAKREFSGWTAFSFDDGHVFTAPVGTYAANPWGFQDMLGNVCEWCADVYDSGYDGRSPKVDPLNAERGDGGARSLRGGSWFSGPGRCGSAERSDVDRDGRSGSRGFRLARTP